MIRVDFEPKIGVVLILNKKWSVFDFDQEYFYFDFD